MNTPLTIEAFAVWCAKQPSDGEYDFYSNGHCPIARFLTENGAEEVNVGGWDWQAKGELTQPLPNALNEAAALEPWTFGALARRLAGLPREPAS